MLRTAEGEMAISREVRRPRGRRLEGADGVYRVRRALRSGTALLAIEADPGSPLPDYRERRRLRERVRTVGAARVILFSDAAGASGVWSWIEREESGPTRYRECAWNPDGGVMPPASIEASDGSESGMRGSPRARRAVRVALLALLRRSRCEAAGDPHPECADPGQLLQDAIERAESAESVRRIWRCAQRVRVLDPACSSAEWLAGAAGGVAMVYLGCLDRMEILLLDAGRSGVPPRRTKLSDFRALLAIADDPRRWPSRRWYARELALSINLRGICADVAAREAVARGLEGWVRGGTSSGPGAPLLALALRCDGQRGGLAGEGAKGAIGDEEWEEEAEAAERAAALLRRAWLAEGAEESAVANAARALRLRLAGIGAQRGGCADVGGGGECRRPHEGGGFHLVRTARR